MPRPLVAVIHLAAMRHNLLVAKTCSPHSKIWAIIKANAYGHGLERGLRGFAAADGLGLIELDAAVRLRELGWQKPILLLEGVFGQADMLAAIENKLEIAVHCAEQVAIFEKIPGSALIDVHLKLNSGMNRLGFKPGPYRDAYQRLRAIPAIRNIALMSHLANSDDGDNPDLSLVQQAESFHAASTGLAGARSLSNSGAILLHPEAAADWVRPGIMLYGGSPGGKTAEEFGLLPAMTLTSEIIGVQDLVAGDAVGYGSCFVADSPMKIGVVACGYADGYPRHAPTGTPIVVDGVRTRIVGRVSMDLITVDLTPIPSAGIGSAVTLWGKDLPIDEVAHAAGTIGYELMCALASRVRTIEA